MIALLLLNYSDHSSWTLQAPCIPIVIELSRLLLGHEIIHVFHQWALAHRICAEAQNVLACWDLSSLVAFWIRISGTAGGWECSGRYTCKWTTEWDPMKLRQAYSPEDFFRTIFCLLPRTTGYYLYPGNPKWVKPGHKNIQLTWSIRGP